MVTHLSTNPARCPIILPLKPTCHPLTQPYIIILFAQKLAPKCRTTHCSVHWTAILCCSAPTALHSAVICTPTKLGANILSCQSTKMAKFKTRQHWIQRIIFTTPWRLWREVTAQWTHTQTQTDAMHHNTFSAR